MTQRDPGLRTTPLLDRHEQLGAKIGPFAGYAMPILYRSIAEEHAAVRSSAGVFDVSHMGRLIFRGSSGAEAIERLVTIHTSGLPVGRARYGFVLTDAGGVLDDVILYTLSDHERLVVVNAVNREAVLGQFASLDVDHATMTDETDATGMIALQGPSARAVLRAALGMVAPDQSMRAMTVQREGMSLIVATTGYTGEDGVELTVPARRIPEVWDRLVEAGAKPAGLGARDTLRLEMAYPLHGHELSPEVTPWEARLGWALDRENGSYCGRERVMGRRDTVTHMLVGLRAEGRAIPRAGQKVICAGKHVGVVTSGTFSPSLKIGIALAYVERELAAEGVRFAVAADAGTSRQVPVQVVPTPFYRQGSRRSSRE